jgi:hypothetical protein
MEKILSLFFESYNVPLTRFEGPALVLWNMDFRKDWNDKALVEYVTSVRVAAGIDKAKRQENLMTLWKFVERGIKSGAYQTQNPPPLLLIQMAGKEVARLLLQREGVPAVTDDQVIRFLTESAESDKSIADKVLDKMSQHIRQVTDAAREARGARDLAAPEEWDGAIERVAYWEYRAKMQPQQVYNFMLDQPWEPKNVSSDDVILERANIIRFAIAQIKLIKRIPDNQCRDVFEEAALHPHRQVYESFMAWLYDHDPGIADWKQAIRALYADFAPDVLERAGSLGEAVAAFPAVAQYIRENRADILHKALGWMTSDFYDQKRWKD